MVLNPPEQRADQEKTPSIDLSRFMVPRNRSKTFLSIIEYCIKVLERKGLVDAGFFVSALWHHNQLIKWIISFISVEAGL